MVEMIITLAIVGVLAGMSVAALNRLKTRGNFASATGDFIAGLRTARAEAFARGDNTVVIIDAQNGQWWAVEDVNGDFNLSTFSAATPAPLPDRLIMSRTLPDGVSFGPSGGWGQALPVPLSGIPTGFLNLPDGGIASVPSDGGSAPAFKFCSFCDSSKMAAITFLPSGGAVFSGGPATIGQQISLQDVTKNPDGGAQSAQTVIDFAVLGATGSVEAITVVGH